MYEYLRFLIICDILKLYKFITDFYNITYLAVVTVHPWQVINVDFIKIFLLIFFAFNFKIGKIIVLLSIDIEFKL